MLENIALRYPNNVSIISALGRVHLQMGNTAAASVMFKVTLRLSRYYFNAMQLPIESRAACRRSRELGASVDEPWLFTPLHGTVQAGNRKF